MNENNCSYLNWLAANTKTSWWNDSAVPDEIISALACGASGITTNPVLCAARSAMSPEFKAGIAQTLSYDEKAEETMKRIILNASGYFMPKYTETLGERGLVCAQVNPVNAPYTGEMVDMAKRLAKWAPNIAIKFPATKAGLEALEECAAEGITVVASVSFTLAQAVAAAQHYEKGAARAMAKGIKPGKGFAVIMIGRVDDYIRDMAYDTGADKTAHVTESDIQKSGLAIVKRAYGIFKERGYKAVLMPAGMRGAYHATELAGADMVLSIHPKIQKLLRDPSLKTQERIDVPVEKDAVDRLMAINEFRRAYEPDGMNESEFLSCGAVQRTMSQFVVEGWNKIV